ncbi:MAG: hypothetical protein ABW055_05180, partial [Pararhizobium sp.]
MNDFTLIETLRYEPPERLETGLDTGFVRLRLHMARLSRSARRLGFTLPDDVPARLKHAVAQATALSRVRLELMRDGRLDIAVVAIAAQPPGPGWGGRHAATPRATTQP